MKKTKIQRIFYPGDQWLYFRIYTGIKTADEILVQVLQPLIAKLSREKVVTCWFFIRYSDSGFHLRIRLLLKNPADMGYVTTLLNKQLKKYGENALLHKTELGTYVRETERYDEKYMIFSEQIFCSDSECIVSILKQLAGKDENYRWMTALLLIDRFLSDLGCDLNAKLDYLTRMNESYKREFGYNLYNAKQLNVIYRDKKKTVENVLHNPENSDIAFVLEAIKKRSKKIQAMLKEHTPAVRSLNVTSYIHMSTNRLFRSQGRTHELLLYDFLARYYKSELARHAFPRPRQES